MSIRKNVLWRMPVFCAAAGFASWYLVMYFFSDLFGLGTGISGSSVSSGSWKLLIIYGVIFAAVIFAGWYLFRGMTKRELLVSCSIASILLLILTILRFSANSSNWSISAVTRLASVCRVFEWSSFISRVWAAIFDGALWVPALLEALAPFIFVIFGRSGKSQSK